MNNHSGTVNHEKGLGVVRNQEPCGASQYPFRSSVTSSIVSR